MVNITEEVWKKFSPPLRPRKSTCAGKNQILNIYDTNLSSDPKNKASGRSISTELLRRCCCVTDGSSIQDFWHIALLGMRCDSIAVKTFVLLLWALSRVMRYTPVEQYFYAHFKTSLDILNSSSLRMFILEFLPSKYGTKLLCRNCRHFPFFANLVYCKTFISCMVLFIVLVCCYPLMEFWVLSSESKLRWPSAFSMKVVCSNYSASENSFG